MSIRVTVVDLDTGDTDERVVADGDYVLIAVEPCYLDGLQAYRNGTRMLTVKGYSPKSLAAASTTAPAADTDAEVKP